MISTQIMAATLGAAIPAPVWSGFDLGPLRIHAYALCILLGIVAAIWLTDRRWKRRGGPEGSIWDIAIWAIPFGIIGGRLYHVFSSPEAYFGPGFNGTGNLALIPQIWLGGLGIWGAVVLGVVGAWIGCRRAGVKISAFIDVAAPGILLAQAIGRWGNYFNQELFGGPTTLPWGLHVDAAFVPVGFSPETLFHPTFLYECIWNLLGVVALLLLDRKFRLRGGRLFLLYAMIYTAGRVWIELLRIDTAEQITFFGITTRLNVWTSILVFLVALLLFLLLTFLRRGSSSSLETVYLAGREPDLDSGVGVDDGAAVPASGPDEGKMTDGKATDAVSETEAVEPAAAAPAADAVAEPAAANTATADVTPAVTEPADVTPEVAEPAKDSKL
ncbi:prolipoprotein diacylglyceryl transferase [Arthrobacter cryoconiti]|uniref:Phosphatidylglycerol--prolipoprotein diacylglyceryl transferase n=1 Tax=Arthrobacter cryoconiti TaxID=748907 RepID=A0ABV8QUY9_9MICC|nr:prolipoprotein diacylglyceryl transferase [Arthrobacter cryoconiti]MCC9069764.1 prolipoprotein diacylglyceryl transferase [Arthrobacter cryoconiti]